MSAPAVRHLLIPDAVLPPETNGPSANPQAALTAEPDLSSLPSLSQLLRVLRPASRIETSEWDAAMPDEIAIAQANGLPGAPDAPDTIAWAAFETRTLGKPCAWIKACHWKIGMGDMVMDAPDSLNLSAEDSRTLLETIAPFWAEDGITLGAGPSPGVWLAVGEPLRGLRTASARRATGRNTAYWLSGPGADTSPAAVLLRRLFSEAQMLFYNLPLNDTRQHNGLAPVNALWATGAGTLDELPQPPQLQPLIENRLCAPAQRRDALAHAQAWQKVDATSCAELLAQCRAGLPVKLTLCGSRAAQSWETAPAPGLLQRLFKFGHKPALNLIQTL